MWDFQLDIEIVDKTDESVRQDLWATEGSRCEGREELGGLWVEERG